MMAEVTEIGPIEAKSLLDDGKAILIDVREQAELEEVTVPGAHHVPLSTFNPDQIPHDDDKKLMFLCAHGIRSYQVSQYLLDQDLLDEALNITGGLDAWIRDGLPYEAS